MIGEDILKRYSLEEVNSHNTPASLWIIIDKKVYDLTKFVDEHPGGSEVILEQAGKDATSSFYDVGHSKDAEEMAKEYLVGLLSEEMEMKSHHLPPKHISKRATFSEIVLSATWSNFLIPVALSVLVYITYSRIKALM
ncbi:hypothetical protein AB6A40_009621 [Gnathostoma spinigerum]|uniref:Cytochrome b5 n=1 Tax=Gnathostoma spinigerum TaxID=75299 RepID=A0ABD6F156_9BILA